MKFLLTLVCSALLLVSCHHNDDPGGYTPPQKATRSVMVYMAGENNLTYSNGYRFLRSDLDEIIEGSKLLKDDERLFVFVDSLNTNNLESGKPFIAEVHGGELSVCMEFSSDFYSCDPDRFQEVLQWMTNKAPADSYGLVLWGHASGWAVSTDTIAQSGARETRAYGQDNGTDHTVGNGTKWMNITQMAKALAKLPKLEFIFADCCNMMCAEVGYELRNVTNYLIGSPAEIPGNGAPYDQLIPYFFANGSQLYKGIIDTYYNYYIEDYKDDYLEGYSVPLSVIETQYIGKLAQATHDVLNQFTGGYPTYPQYPNTSDIAFYWYYDTPIMYDMRAFVKTHVQEEDFAKWEQAFKLAVPYHRMSMEWMTIYSFLEWSFSGFNQDESIYGCVSMFIPKSTSTYQRGEFYYNSTYNNYGWNRALEWNRFGWP